MSAEFRMIQRAHLAPPSHPMRLEMSDAGMVELIASISALGVLQALLVFPLLTRCPACVAAGIEPCPHMVMDDLERYEIIDGHRRYIASEHAGVEYLPCRVFASAEEARHAMMLDATMCHEDFTPAEEGQQFVELSEKHGWSLEELCKQFRKSEHYINARVHLVNTDGDVAAAVHRRQINLAQATELLLEKDPERRRTRLLLAIEHGYNARELRVMRQNLESERRVAAGELAPHTSPFAVPPEPTAPRKCVWCDGDKDPENLHQVDVHWYHKAELLAVVDQVGLKNVLRAGAAKPEGA